MKHNTRRMPTNNNYLSNRNVNDLLYGYLQSISYLDDSKVRFVYAKDINKSHISETLNISRPTLNKYFKYLINFGFLKETYVSDNYENYVKAIELPENSDKFIPIDINTLVKLIDTTNSDVIKVYTWLKVGDYYKKKTYGKDSSYNFTYAELIDKIGYKKSNTSHRVVQNILQSLTYLGLIECSWNGVIGKGSKFYLNKINDSIPKKLKDVNRNAYSFSEKQPKTRRENKVVN